MLEELILSLPREVEGNELTLRWNKVMECWNAAYVYNNGWKYVTRADTPNKAVEKLKEVLELLDD